MELALMALIGIVMVVALFWIADNLHKQLDVVAERVEDIVEQLKGAKQRRGVSFAEKYQLDKSDEEMDQPSEPSKLPSGSPCDMREALAREAEHSSTTREPMPLSDSLF